MALRSLTTTFSGSVAMPKNRSIRQISVSAPKARGRSALSVRAYAIDSKVDADLSNYARIPGEVDEEIMHKEKTFPIPPSSLIMLCKRVLAKNNGVDDPTLLADNFEFAGPVVGPLKKPEFLKAVGGFDLFIGFPDLNPNYHHFRVDPFEPNRVWFTVKPEGTHTGVLAGRIQPTGKVVRPPPQANSMRFDETGRVLELTVGYCMDRRIGNTANLGGIFAFFYGVGAPIPFPEGQPWKMSFRYWLFQQLPMVATAIANIGKIFGGGGKTN